MDEQVKSIVIDAYIAANKEKEQVVAGGITIINTDNTDIGKSATGDQENHAVMKERKKNNDYLQ